jgi:hypothetical protein
VTAVSACAAALVLALAGCTGGSGKSGTSPTPAVPYNGPTGKQLASIMLTINDLPSGYTETNGGEADSGQARATATLTASPSSSNCNALLNTIGGTNLGEAAFAYDTYAPNSATAEFSESVLEFPGNQATKLAGQFGAALNGCGTFQAQEEDGTTNAAKTLMQPGPRVGNESIGFQVDVSIGNVSLATDGVIVRVGSALIILENTDYSGTGPSSGAINLDTLTATLVQRLGTLH